MVYLVALILALTGCASAEGQRGPGNGGARNRGDMGGMTNKASDAELLAILAEVQDQFQLLTFEDAETGAALQYQLYVPENNDGNTLYPLLQFIPDSSVVGKGANAVLTQGWGGVVWATKEEQAKHPSFIVIPIFTETVVNDNFTVSGEVDTAVRLIEYLTQTYSIDTHRIYTTGQSMGGMTSFHLNVTYPDLFAASLYVGSQWDIHLLNALEDDTFFYIVAAGDPKASAGQAELLALFEQDGAVCSQATWSAQDSADTQNAAVESLLAEKNSANFITFTLGSTLTEGQTAGSGAGEHMTSFDYAYKLEAVRDWLFAQSK